MTGNCELLSLLVIEESFHQKEIERFAHRGAYTQQQHFQLIYGGFEGLGHDVIITPYMYEAIVP
jgi:hypothetical protein